MSLPFITPATIEELRNLRRLGHSLESLARRLRIEHEALCVLMGEPYWKETPTEPEAPGNDE